ncbi:hypothetical protein Noc_1940 [Nitrosococcus oceani ATCC 19707]|uniref:Alpha-L-glutamate ligase-related protein ATP-grasp domain-containing protein n=2 Tax=Nitrosococcus oceani TaxID=1229 RepID=Q3J9U4_NITOC|nr:sugar-transfer associated ATP-grasp domain-containing protein [Nitrosococcus oceani]ABA58402.1 hypothetical protein Noc_1940 [Nitrosococcus oceani ATCC 19707]EDZ66928.1 hypothetical protein NOC27_255 [Nitrosococcus oceani AFC27]KFI19120.1 hypothetical protein IB75_10355 [Nitrosococcus oceani C-27]GEM18797.1 hypothetical protein NONS58_01580 [Nitrosococcus oceani]
MFWRLRQRVSRFCKDFAALPGVLWEHGRAARKASGKSLLGQASEMIALRWGKGRLAPDEYYQYCLFDDRRFSPEQKRTFLGRHMQYDLWELFDSWSWHAIANDKLVACSLFEALQLPSPKLYGFFHPIRRHGALPIVRNGAQLGQFLREQAPFPLVAKPVLGMWGKNVYAIERLEHESDELVLVNGKRMAIADFVAALEPLVKQGWLFQELLKPHPMLLELCGNRICSVRVVTLLDPAPIIISTLWKVAVGNAMADNYWEPGNLVGPIDPETGVVGQMFTGLGLQRRNVSEHPDTGEKLVGITLPNWEQTLELCREGTASLPGLKMQAWDIALTDRGPVMLEVNIIGGVRLPQLVVDAGMNRGPLREMLRKHRYM